MIEWLTELTLQYCTDCHFKQVFQNLFTVSLQPPITNSLSWKAVLRPAWHIHILLLALVQPWDFKAQRASTALCWKSLHGKTVATFSRFFLNHIYTLFSLLPASLYNIQGSVLSWVFSCCFFPRRAREMSKRFLSLHTVIPAHRGSRNQSCCTKAQQTQIVFSNVSANR